MKMNLREYMKKDPLRICTIEIMVIALLIIFLITSYAFELNILPRLIPDWEPGDEIPEEMLEG
ncbi:MAG: hypothetical protein PVF58_06125 [Candidatus Methanofastidiosia archaeon]